MISWPVTNDAIRDAVRYRIPVIWLAWAVAAVVLTPVAKDFGLGAQARVAADLVLGSAWLVTCAVAIFSGQALCESPQTDQLLVARGASAQTLWMARFAGANLTIAAWVAGVAAIYALIAALFTLPLGASGAVWALLLWMEAVILLSASASIRKFLPLIPAVATTVTLWWTGHMAHETAALAAAGHTSAPWLYAILPDLDRFDGQTPLVTHSPLTFFEVLTAGGIATAWIVAAVGFVLWRMPMAAFPPDHGAPRR